MTAPTWIVDDDGDLCYGDPEAEDETGWIWIHYIDLRKKFRGATDRIDVDDAYEDLAEIVRHAEPGNTWAFRWQEQFARAETAEAELGAALAVIRRFEAGWERGRGGGTDTWWIDGRGSRPAEPMTPAEQAAIAAARTDETTDG